MFPDAAIRLLSCWAVMVSGCLALIPMAHAENYAFLVGVGDYDPKELQPLPFTRNDIQEFSRALQNSRYEKQNIVLMHDDIRVLSDKRYLPIARNIRDELQLLLSVLDPADSIIVAFAGHGVQFSGENVNYFCASDARLDDKDRSSLVSMKDVYEALEKCPAKRKLLLVDACRNDPQSTIKRSGGNVKLESVTRPQSLSVPGGLVAFFSCAAGQRSFESPELKHGVFFHSVLKGWQGAADNGDGNLTVTELAGYVTKETKDYVRLNLGAAQTPYLKAELIDEWVLTKTKAIKAVYNRRAEVDQALASVDLSKNSYQVEFDTTLGTILLDLFPDVAPGHVKNLIGLTKIGFYDGLIFHRVVKSFIIQTGCPEGTGTGGPGYHIPDEFNKTPHDVGILSMAHAGPETAGSQFFICLSRKNSEHLDNRFTAFGKTADQASLDVVNKIGNVETNDDNRPITEVKINKGRVITRPKN